MPLRTSAHRLCRSSLGWTLALIVYGAVLLTGSFLHHDLACHIKSRAHCTSCAFNASACGIEGPVPVPVLQPGESGRPVMDVVDHLGRETLRRPQDRSPPA